MTRAISACDFGDFIQEQFPIVPGFPLCSCKGCLLVLDLPAVQPYPIPKIKLVILPGIMDSYGILLARDETSCPYFLWSIYFEEWSLCGNYKLPK